MNYKIRFINTKINKNETSLNNNYSYNTCINIQPADSTVRASERESERSKVREATLT